jgi:hypothetical protein
MKKLLSAAVACALALVALPAAAAPTASIDFVQGATNPAAGIALCTGVTGTSVGISNGSGAGVLSWQVDLNYAPAGSTVSRATLASNNNSSTPAASFTPDIRGCYRVVLYVWNVINRAGPWSEYDVRDFCVPEVNGHLSPPAQIYPPAPPALASGKAGAKANELNCGGVDGVGYADFSNQLTKDVDANLPTTAQKAALAGTNGAPGAGNKYVTDTDPRLVGGGGGGGGVSGITQLTGVVTAGPGSGSQATSVTANAITLGMMAQLPTLTLIGNSTGGTANAAALTMATLRSMIGLSCTDISSATSAGCALLTAASVAAQQAALSLTPGTNVQAFNANLSAFAGVSLIADRLVYANGTGTLALTTYTAAARTFDAAADAAAETAILNVFGTTTKGLVPSPGTVSGNCLHDNGGWSACTGSSSVNATTAESAAPATPSAGNVATWVDSTDARFHDKNPAGTIGTTVVADTGAANNFLTGISAAGVPSKAQVAFSNLSGAGTCAQEPALTGVVTSSAGSCATSFGATTGSGSVVLATTPTLVTPVLGAATATTINKLTFTQPATGSTLTLLDGVTLTVSSTLNTNQLALLASPTFTGTVTLPAVTLTGAVAGGGKYFSNVGGQNWTLTNDGTKSGAAPALADFTVTQEHTMVLGSTSGTPTWTWPTLSSAAFYAHMEVCQDATGTRTLTWPSSPTLAWIGGTPTLSTAANACDYFSFRYDGTKIVGAPVNASGGGGITAGTGDATFSGTGSVTVTNVNAPDGFTQAGKIVATEIAAPATPAAGKVSTWVDSTDARFHDKNPAGVIGTTVVADTGAANNYISAISAAGVITKSQVAFSNLSGSGTCAQEPALTGDTTSSAGSCATTIAANAVSNAKMATMAANTVKANNTGSTATPTDVTMSAMLTAIAALPLAGGTMSGAIAMANNSVTGVKAVTYNGVVDNGNEGGAAPALLTWAAGSSQKLTLTSSITGTPTWTLPSGTQYLQLDVCQNATGGFVMTWPTVTWDGGSAPVLTSTALACTRVSLRYDGTTVTGSSGNLYAKIAGTLAQFASTTSAQFFGVISDEQGSGPVVGATSPTLTTPNIGAATATSIAMGNGNITAAKAVYLNGKVAGGNKGGATVALFDWTAGPYQAITLTSSVTGTSTCTAPTATVTGLTALVTQGAGGSFTVASWCPGTKWVGGTAPTLSTVAARVDRITCDYDGTSYYCKAEINLQ